MKPQLGGQGGVGMGNFIAMLEQDILDEGEQFHPNALLTVFELALAAHARLQIDRTQHTPVALVGVDREFHHVADHGRDRPLHPARPENHGVEIALELREKALVEGQ